MSVFTLGKTSEVNFGSSYIHSKLTVSTRLVIGMIQEGLRDRCHTGNPMMITNDTKYIVSTMLLLL